MIVTHLQQLKDLGMRIKLYQPNDAYIKWYICI